MLKNLFRIFKILKKREKITFFIISFFTVLATLLEMISLGSIPIYVSFILEPDKISNYLSNFKSLVFINEFSKEDILVFLSVTLVFIFILKSLFLAFFHYFNGLFLRKQTLGFQEKFITIIFIQIICFTPLKHLLNSQEI